MSFSFFYFLCFVFCFFNIASQTLTFILLFLLNDIGHGVVTIDCSDEYRHNEIPIFWQHFGLWQGPIQKWNAVGQIRLWWDWMEQRATRKPSYAWPFHGPNLFAKPWRLSCLFSWRILVMVYVVTIDCAIIAITKLFKRV